MRYTLDPNHPHSEDLDDGRRVAPGEPVDLEPADVPARLAAALLPQGDDVDAATDEQVLTDPGAHTADRVVEALARNPELAEDAQALEAGGKGRKTIADWQPPTGGVNPNPED